MPRCKNCPPSAQGCYYTGKENTPRGRGYCAMHEKEGKRMKGTDGRMYVVSKTRSGSRWNLAGSSSGKNKKTSPRMMNEDDFDFIETVEATSPDGHAHVYKDDDGKMIYEDNDLRIVTTFDDRVTTIHESEGTFRLVDFNRENLDTINRLEDHLQTALDFFEVEAGTYIGRFLVKIIEMIRNRLKRLKRDYDIGRSNLQEYPHSYKLNKHAMVVPK